MLRRTLSKISLTDKNDSEKWRREINKKAAGQQPIPESGSLTVFDSLELRRTTDACLKKRKLSQQELDALCCDLINKHNDKIIALASCAHKLSPSALRRVLEAFATDGRNPTLYLQAFVAAYYDCDEGAIAHDKSWAQSLISISRLPATQVPSPDVIRKILMQYRNRPPPSDVHIGDRADTLIHTVCEKTRAVLDSCQAQRDWLTAVPLASVLSEQLTLRRQGVLSTSSVEVLLDTNIHGWRPWAYWRPNQKRLQEWKKLSADAQLSPLWSLLGPDLQPSESPYDSQLSRLVRDASVVSWLGRAGFVAGAGLLFDDSAQTFARFIGDLTATIDVMVTQSPAAEQFFRHLCRDRTRGLDESTLQLWHSAVMQLFPKAPKFSALLFGTSLQPEGMVDVLKAGLTALDGIENEMLRTYFAQDIERVLSSAGKLLLLKFLQHIQEDLPWQSKARDLLDFRQLLNQWSWPRSRGLHVEGLAMSGNFVLSSDGLDVLHGVFQELRARGHQLRESAVTYTSQVVCGVEPHNDEMVSLVERLHLVWLSPRHTQHHIPALFIADLEELPVKVRMDCIAGLLKMKPSGAKTVQDALSGTTSDDYGLLRQFLATVAKIVKPAPASKESWQTLVKYVFALRNASPYDPSPLVDATGFSVYRILVSNIEQIFGHSAIGVISTWLERLAHHSKALASIESLPNSLQAVRFIISVPQEPAAILLIELLEYLQQEKELARRRLMEHLILRLSVKRLESITHAVKLIAGVSEGGLGLCDRLLILSDQQSPQVARIQMEVWLRRCEIDSSTDKCLRALSGALSLPMSPKPESAQAFFGNAIATIMQRASKAEAMMLAIRQHDRKGVKNLLQRLGIEEHTTAIQEMMEELPPDIVSHVEAIDDYTVDLQFTLARLTDIQRLATGLKKGESIVLRLTVDSDGRWSSYCVHVSSPHVDLNSFRHRPFMANTRQLPSRPQCQSQNTLLEYVVASSVQKGLQSGAAVGGSLLMIHRYVQKSIENFGNHCTVCQVSIGSARYRPTLCSSHSCFQRWLQFDPQLRLTDLANDASVVAVLLSAVLAAATTMSASRKNCDLLPGRPSRLNNNSTLLQTLNKMPTLVSNSNRHISITADVELVLSWTCNHYRGFLTTANGPQRIPNLPGVLQFVLADNAPETTAAFDKHAHLQQRQVLFHGTTLDRVYAILCQGLKVLSNTALSAHGASSGAGIYLAEEPSTSMYYAQPMALQGNFATHQHDYTSRGVLFAVEYAGTYPGSGVHVETDPSRLLLRYMFLVPPGWAPPLRAHIEPALSSNFNSLRAGARKG